MTDSTGPSADLDLNGMVDGQGFGLLLFDWEESGHTGPAALNGGGRVNDADSGDMFLQWGDSADWRSQARESMLEDRRPVSSLR